MTEAEQVMKRCQIGTRNHDEANNLHADCYRVIGKLLAEHAMRETQRLGQEIEQCQCPECQIKPHASDCAVHGEPAYPKGKCNCGAQPEQEPVAWINPDEQNARKAFHWVKSEEFSSAVYTHPPQRTEQEPLQQEAAALFRQALAFGLAYGPAIPAHQWAEMREEKVAQLVLRLAASQPPQRTEQPAQRKPLTDEQRKDLMNKAWDKWLGGKDDNHLFAWHFSFEVEAAHGIKENT